MTARETAALLPACVLFEDDHLLVVNKPAGWNTHAPSPFAGEGLYEWLRHREPRWAKLATIQRLDKETSGVILFAKSPQANHSLTNQFARRRVTKKYHFWTDRPVKPGVQHAVSCLVRVKDHYVSQRESPDGQHAETRFRVLTAQSHYTLIEALPLTGRTHQIRVHAADLGFPILGDELYGGTPYVRVCLHASELILRHPVSGQELVFRSPVSFGDSSRLDLRRACIHPDHTNAYRLSHGAADGQPGLYVDRLGDVFLVQTEHDLVPAQITCLTSLVHQVLDHDHQVNSSDAISTPAITDPNPFSPGLLVESSIPAGKSPRSGGLILLHKRLRKDVRRTDAEAAGPQSLTDSPAPPEWIVRENGVQYCLRSTEGYSTGLFLDQRENRRRLLTGHVAAEFPLYAHEQTQPELLNTFAYTCGFSVCAALSGAKTTSLDLSPKYLNWGQQNFRLNGLDPAAHEFIYGDCFDWLKRLARKQRAFDFIILDPPTFSTSKVSGVFRVEKDYGKLISATLPLLKSHGVLLACANTERLEPERFLNVLEATIGACGRKVRQKFYVPQPSDFPLHRDEPAYLKTVWLRIS